MLGYIFLLPILALFCQRGIYILIFPLFLPTCLDMDQQAQRALLLQPALPNIQPMEPLGVQHPVTPTGTGGLPMAPSGQSEIDPRSHVSLQVEHYQLRPMSVLHGPFSHMPFRFPQMPHMQVLCLVISLLM